ncbi:MAG: dihydroorotase [Chloroflexota bacterium]|nr:dihydroorotase [Chloroflexota bacterium]
MILEGTRRMDPERGIAETTDVRVGAGTERIDGEGFLVAPGFIDLHAHLREPGFEDSETIATGAHAALRGGFTTVCAMPNTEPPVDSPGLIAELLARGSAARGARVLPIAAITRGRRGRELADLVELAAAGAVAFSDDGAAVDDARLFRSALEYAHSVDRPVIEHAQDSALSARGAMHEGEVSALLGLPGIPAAAEDVAVARDIALARETGGRLHLAHLSTAGAVELVRRAKAQGVRVTAEVTPHHLALTDAWVAGDRAFAWERPHARRNGDAVDSVGAAGVEGAADVVSAHGEPYDSATKVNPPLRTEADVRACWAGLADGTIDAIATDHAPHASVHKDVEFQEAAFGVSAIETALPLLLAGAAAGWGDLDRIVAALTVGPARVLGRALDPADIVVIDPALEWKVTADALVSRGKNTPLLGRTLRGRVVAAAVGGELRYDALTTRRERGQATAGAR